jgi:hypothetical protein
MTMFEVTELMGNIGELVGSVAVLVTIIYLAIQIKHARAQSLLGIAEGRITAMRELYAQQNEGPMREILSKANDALGFSANTFELLLMERADLTREEASAVFLMYVQWLNFARHQFQVLSQLSAIDRSVYDTALYFRFGENTIGELFYEIMKPTLEQEFTEYADGVLSQKEAFGYIDSTLGR